MNTQQPSAVFFFKADCIIQVPGVLAVDRHHPYRPEISPHHAIRLADRLGDALRLIQYLFRKFIRNAKGTHNREHIDARLISSAQHLYDLALRTFALFPTLDIFCNDLRTVIGILFLFPRDKNIRQLFVVRHDKAKVFTRLVQTNCTQELLFCAHIPSALGLLYFPLFQKLLQNTL